MAVNVLGVLPGSEYGRLDEWRRAADEAQQCHVAMPVVEWGGRALEMRATGARGWRYVLISPDLRVLVRPRPDRRVVEPDHVMQCQVSAAWCWRDGHRAVAEALTEWASGIGVGGLRLQLSRIDLAVDFQSDVQVRGYHCPYEILGEWVTPSALSSADHRRGRQWTGKTFGRRPGVLVRLYDKTEEIRTASHKTWFREMWTRSGCCDPAQAVMRLEVAVPRPLLRDCERGHSGSLASWWPRLPALWRRTLCKTVRLAVPARDTHRDRWAVHPLWRVLMQRPTFGEIALGEVVPAAASGADTRRAMSGLLGYLRLLAAASSERVEDERTDAEALLRTFALVLDEFPAHWQRYQRRARRIVTWRERVADRRALARAFSDVAAAFVAARGTRHPADGEP